MNDDSGYSLRLVPETFAIIAFQFFKSEDASKMMNGFFVALKEDRLEEWWEELMAQPSLG